MIRYGIGALAAVAAAVTALVGGVSEASIEAAVSVVGIGMALVLLAALRRLGAGDQAEHDHEEAARRFFDAHGRWPEDEDRREERAGARKLGVR